MASKREVNLIVSALLLVSAYAFAQPPGYQKPDPPFYTFDVPLDINFNITQPPCMSVDGNVPAYVTATTLANMPSGPGAANLAPCAAGSSFASSGSIFVNPPVNFNDSGNTMTISTTDTTAPSYSPAYGPNWTGATGVTYEQQFYAPPGSQIALSYLINGNGYVTIDVVSPCPDPPGDCVVGSTGATPTYGAFTSTGLPGASPTPIGAPTANNAVLKLPPFTVSSMGTYVVGIWVTTGFQYPFPYNQAPYSISVSAGCGIDATLGNNGLDEITGVAWPTLTTLLSQSATLCGYSGFDWQQWITNLPCPNPFEAAVPGNLPFANFCPSPTLTPFALTAGNSGFGSTSAPFLDAPQGGYTYAIVSVADQWDPLGPYNPYPFYTTAGIAETPGALVPAWVGDPPGFVPHPVNFENKMLYFYDGPSDACLDTAGPLLPAAAAALLARRALDCGGSTSTAPPGSYIGFQTSLVGINTDGSSGPPLFTWTWTDTFNGTAGNISSLVTKYPVDPGSGVGNVSITSINGVPVPPIIPPTQVSTTASGLAYSRVTKTFDGTVTLTNISGITLTTPTSFQLVLNSLPTGVTLVNSMGTFNQCPYITIPALLSLTPGQSVTIAVQFSNPSNATINFTPEFYAGSFQ